MELQRYLNSRETDTDGYCDFMDNYPRARDLLAKLQDVYALHGSLSTENFATVASAVITKRDYSGD